MVLHDSTQWFRVDFTKKILLLQIFRNQVIEQEFYLINLIDFYFRWTVFVQPRGYQLRLLQWNRVLAWWPARSPAYAPSLFCFFHASFWWAIAFGTLSIPQVSTQSKANRRTMKRESFLHGAQQLYQMQWKITSINDGRFAKSTAPWAGTTHTLTQRTSNLRVNLR